MHTGEDSIRDVNWCLTPNASARDSVPGADAAVGVCRRLERTDDSRPDGDEAPARAGRPEAGPKGTPPTRQAKNRSLYMFGDRYPLQEIKAWLARASIRTAIKPTLGRLA
jgi:hypothetical protein